MTERTESPRGQRLAVNGLEIYFEDYGKGSPLVLLHGFGGSSQNWKTFAPELAEHYRIVAVDLRGHGRSTNPSNRFTHREAAQDVLQLLEKLGISRYSALGISSGGMTLLHMAAARPQDLEAMVLVSATTHFPDQARTIMGRVSLATLPPAVRAHYQESAVRGESQIAQLLEQFRSLSKNEEDMQFTGEILSRIPTRTLVIHGDRDNFFPIEIPVNLYRSLPRAALWIIPGGGHVPIEDPRVPFIPTVLDFLRSPDGGSL